MIVSARFFDVVRLLAASPATTISKLQPIRENDREPLLATDNALRLLSLLTNSVGVYEGGEGSETVANWSLRTGLPSSFLGGDAAFNREPLGHLWTACHLIETSDRYYLHTAHGIRSSREWSLVRYLAELTLSANSIDLTSDLPSIAQLWADLGGGTLEAPEPRGR
ncbi:hypothetical protein Poly24_54910 [Rosistilla carotiformis]|uniref:Uncharacterized protein n=1 Tax=Rosistilla carotiformis TaxID=2528017 RepID=A0A518K1R4_9BACT|nr:hypothetical protein Poly24_54910 [Rosistilla carotiformis]